VGIMTKEVTILGDDSNWAGNDISTEAPHREKNSGTPANPMTPQNRQVVRPWGFYESLIISERYQVKRIVVDPGAQLSLQKHFHRSEHWVVIEGSALVTRNESRSVLNENESIFLPVGCIHRLENPGRIPLTIIEVQVGSYLGEDDIVRFEDSYGRD
jgi:mannose-1-phosphate guanylyltransferase / mannose-6-phosphate isomerase